MSHYGQALSQICVTIELETAWERDITDWERDITNWEQDTVSCALPNWGQLNPMGSHVSVIRVGDKSGG